MRYAIPLSYLLLGAMWPTVGFAAVWTSYGPANASVKYLLSDGLVPGALYAATAGNVDRGGCNNGKGIFKRGAGDSSWTQVNSGLTADVCVTAFAIDRAAPQTAFAALGSELFKTTNGGATWIPSDLGLPDAAVTAIEVDPHNSHVVYVGTSDKNGVFKSLNGGQTWASASVGLLTTTPAPGFVPTVLALHVDSSSGGTVYAGTDDRGGVYKSTDGGGQWNPMNTGFPSTPVGVPGVSAVVVNSGAPGTVYAGLKNHGVYKSTDGGLHWAAAGAATGPARVVWLLMDPKDPSTLYAVAGLSSVYKTIDGGASWAELTKDGLPLSIGQIGPLAVDAAGKLYGGVGNGQGVYRLDEAPVATATPQPTPSVSATVTPGSIPSATRTATASPTGTATGNGVPTATTGVATTVTPTANVAGTPLPTATPAPGGVANRKCRGAIVKAAAAFVQASVKTAQGCAVKVIAGKLPSDTDCQAESSVVAGLAKARQKFRGAIGKACGGKDKACGTSDDTPLADAGWSLDQCPGIDRGSCDVPATNCTGLVDCLSCIAEASLKVGSNLSFADFTFADPKDKHQKMLNKCEVAIASTTAKFVATRAKGLQKCRSIVNAGKAFGPCPAADTKVQATFAKAETKRRAAICKACGGGDKLCGTADDLTPVEINFPPVCPDVSAPGVPSCAGAVHTLDDLTACVGCVARFGVDCADRSAAITFEPYPPECSP